MQTDIDDPRVKLMQKWSQETPEDGLGAEALGADEDESEDDDDDADGVGEMFIGKKYKGNKASNKGKNDRKKKQEKRKDEKKKDKNHKKGKGRYSEETLLEHKSGSLGAADTWFHTVWDKLSEPVFNRTLSDFGSGTVSIAKRAVLAFNSNPTSDSYLTAYKAIDAIKKSLRENGSRGREKKNDRLITVSVSRTITGINRDVFNLVEKKGITSGAQTIYYNAKLTQDYVEALRNYVKASTQPHSDKPNPEDHRPVRAHEPNEFVNDPFHQLTLMETSIKSIFKMFHDSTQKLEHKPVSALRNHNPYYSGHHDEDSAHLLIHDSNSASTSRSVSRAPSVAGSTTSTSRRSNY